MYIYIFVYQAVIYIFFAGFRFCFLFIFKKKSFVILLHKALDKLIKLISLPAMQYKNMCELKVRCGELY